MSKVLFIFPNTANKPLISMAIPILMGIAKKMNWVIDYFDTANYEKEKDSVQDRETTGEFIPRPRKNKIMDRPKTIICDIDGVIFEHCGDITKQHLVNPQVLQNVHQVWREWDIKGYRIILVTGRRESVRKETEEQLSRNGIFYDTLIMGATGGERVLINDRKANSTNDTAFAVNVTRNEGMNDVKV